MSINRRQCLRGSLLAGLYLGTPVLLSACGKSRPHCTDPDTLGAGERQMRKTLAYVETSSQEGYSCANCRFFHTADAASSCGRCELLDGAVSRAGHCTSWAG